MAVTIDGNTGISSPQNITIETVGSNWTVALSGTSLLFSYNGSPKMKLNSDGSLVVAGDVTAFGTL